MLRVFQIKRRLTAARRFPKSDNPPAPSFAEGDFAVTLWLFLLTSGVLLAYLGFLATKSMFGPIL
jgi:hypothetical protein